MGAGLDPRIADGTSRMLAVRREAVAGGAEPLGWKVGFGAPSSLAALRIDRPLVGFLTRDRLLADGATVDISDWTKPLLEAEVAAYVARDVGAGATPAGALAAVGGWAVAIELADLDHPSADVAEILGGNIYHRHVLLGPVNDHRPGSLAFRVLRDGAELAATSSPEELTGELGSVLAATADTLGRCGSGLRAGEVVITGSVVPPVDVSAGGLWRVEADGLGELSVDLL